MADLIDRMPPCRVEAEEAVLGSCLMDSAAAPLAASILKPADFFREAHRTVFQAVVDLLAQGHPVDFVSLGERLKSTGAYDDAKGIQLLSRFVDVVPTAVHVESYARLVAEAAARRRLIQASARMAQLAYDQERPLAEVTAAIWQELTQAQQAADPNGAHSPPERADILVRLVADIEERQGAGLTSGLPDLDRVLHGLRPGQLIVVAARPSVGKSALLQGISRHVATRHGPVLFCSAEMTDDELVARDAATLMGRSWREVERELASKCCSPETTAALSRARAGLESLRLHVYFDPRMTTSTIRAKSQEVRAKHGLSMVAVDYLQLLKDTDGSRDSDNVRVARISSGLKALAGELRVPVLVASQLNRQVESRRPPIPELSDMRDCLPASALVLNADTSERVPVGEIVSAGARFNVWSLDADFRLQATPIVDAWYVNEQQVFQVTTRTGRRLRCTAGHRLRSLKGWVELRELNVGDAVALPRVYPASMQAETGLTEDQATLLGWLIGDGHLGGSATLTVTDRIEAESAADLGRRSFGLEPTIKAERAGTAALRVVMTTGRLSGAGKNPPYLGSSDVIWDEITAIEPGAVEPVYDITVGQNSSFCVDDFVVHNSGAIEQDSDVVIGLYRADRYYEPGSSDHDGGTVQRGSARLEVLKQRGGPAPVVLNLVWVETLCEYRSLARESDRR